MHHADESAQVNIFSALDRPVGIEIPPPQDLVRIEHGVKHRALTGTVRSTHQSDRAKLYTLPPTERLEVLDLDRGNHALAPGSTESC